MGMITKKAGHRMEFHGIGQEEHGTHTHHVTKCMFDHTHYKKEADISKAASAARSQSVPVPEQQNDGPFSLTAWLDNHLSKGKSLLKGFWSGGTAPAGEIGDRAGRELTQLSDSKDVDRSSQNVGSPGTDRQPADLTQAVHVSRAAQAAAVTAPSREQGAAWSAAGEESGQEGILRRMRVRFKDIAGQLAGHLRGNTSRFQAKRSFQEKQAVTRAEPEKKVKPKRDAVEIDKYHVEESYLLDSYDRKGGYSKISTKK